jgi:hypothetical protein
VASGQLSVPLNTPTSITLTASGTNPQLRVIQQPMHGTVGIAAKVATYFPDTGYQGPDYFTYIASDSASYIDSQPATISVTIGTATNDLDADGDGINDWIEYALGLDTTFRTSTGPQSQIESINGTNYLMLRALKGPMPPNDMTLTIKSSPDLTNWSASTVITNNSAELKARDNASASSQVRSFMRIEVTRSTPNP